MKVAFLYPPVAFGQHRKPLDFSDLDGHTAGLTGTDLVALSYARELARLGHDVTMFCHGAEPTTYEVDEDTDDEVGVLPYTVWERHESREQFDVAVAISNPNCLKLAAPRTLRVLNRQVSRFGIDCEEFETWGFDRFVDLYTCPSDHARVVVSGGAPHPEKFRTLPNGCYPETLGGVEKVRGSVAYCSSPDRGLHLLLSVWSEIRRLVPYATLTVAYQSLGQWLAFHCDSAKRFGGQVDRECTQRALYVREGIRRLRDHGVRVHDGGLSHREIGRVLSETEVLAFPCSVLAHTETFSVATLEAAAAGAVPVVSDADCLEEVHGGAAVVVRGVERNLGKFTDAVVNLLTDEGLAREMRELGREHAREHDWRVLAKRFESLLVDGLEGKRTPNVSVSEPSRVQPRAPYTVKFGDRVLGDGPSVTSSRVEINPRVAIDLILTRYASGDEPIDVDHPFDSNSGGGCRAGFMGLVRELPMLGYDVRAWSNFVTPGFAKECSNAGNVLHQQWPKDWQPGHPLPFEPRDVLVCYYDTSPLCGVPGDRTLRVGSHHTYQLPFPGTYEWADLNVAPSQHAADALRAIYGGEWGVMPNAVQPDLPEWRPVPGRCVWHTSASRGLWNLLEAWPEIREQVPGATLHIVGDVPGWLTHYRERHDLQAKFARRTMDALAALDALDREGSGCGVRFLGKLPRADVLRELSEASCFPFSFEAAAPCETWSVCTMEALAVGVPVVLYPGDAMGSIYAAGDSPVEAVYSRGRDFRDMIVRVLSGEGRTSTQARQVFGRSYTFANKARALDGAIRTHLRRVPE